MKESFAMHIGQSLQSLKYDITNFMMRYFSFFLNQLINIFMQILKDEVKLIFFFDKLKQLYYIRMMQFRQNTNFIQINAFVPIFVFMLHFFYCDQLPSLLIYPFYYTSKSTISKFIT